MTYRILGLASLVVVAALQMGCCSSPCGKGMGCGRTYWGAYADNPPTCEPCDKCGNFTGGNRRTCKKQCEADCDFQWNRGQKVSFLGGLFNCDMFNGGGKSSCTEISCGEPTCAEPSCGSTPNCGCTGVSYESGPAMTSSYGEPRMTNASYSQSNWSTLGSSGGCNCKKH